MDGPTHNHILALLNGLTGLARGFMERGKDRARKERDQEETRSYDQRICDVVG